MFHIEGEFKRFAGFYVLVRNLYLSIELGRNTKPDKTSIFFENSFMSVVLHRGLLNSRGQQILCSVQQKLRLFNSKTLMSPSFCEDSWACKKFIYTTVPWIKSNKTFSSSIPITNVLFTRRTPEINIVDILHSRISRYIWTYIGTEKSTLSNWHRTAHAARNSIIKTLR